MHRVPQGSNLSVVFQAEPMANRECHSGHSEYHVDLHQDREAPSVSKEREERDCGMCILCSERAEKETDS